MDKAQDLQLRQVSRGFIVCNKEQDALIGRRLTKAYVDQYDRTYVMVNGEFEPLTEQHNYLAVD